MNKNIILAILLLVSCSCYSQVDHIEMLIGKTDSEVTQYFDSLNSLKNNPYYKIKRDVTDNGDLMLSVEFALSDGGYYTCSSIMTRFERVKGIEICVTQGIVGSTEFAQGNLSFIKDNFEVVSEGRWKKPYGHSNRLEIAATFGRKEGEYPNYVILYEVQDVK
jgi:hypothetical protein